MNKKIAVPIIIVVIIILGVFAFSYGKKGPGSTGDINNQTSPISTAKDGSKGESSFKDMLAMGKSQKCEVNYPMGETTSSGVMYMAAGKMRGDFSAKVQDKTIQSHMIVKDQTAYSWTDGMGATMGFKMAINSNTSVPSSGADTSKPQGIDANQHVNYDCSNWSEDDSVFNLPSGITFNDASSMIGSGSASTSVNSESTAKSAQCAACDNLPASSKSQCLTALKCN